MKLSFIVPCYNEEQDIVNTIKACLAQNYKKEYEIILIDDGSKDNTLDILHKYSKENKNVKVLSYGGNKGVSFARNYGIEKSEGEILIFLNADEIPPVNFLSLIEKHFDEGADYLFPQTEVSNKSSIYGLYREAYRRNKYIFPNMVLWSQGFACRKSVLNQIEGFNTNYPGCGGEDWDIVTRIEELAKKRVVDWSITVKHRVPEKANEVMWHMFNRGRGTANFDLIRMKRSSRAILTKALLNVSLLSLVFLFHTKLIVIALLYFLYKHLVYSYKITKKINSTNRVLSVAFMSFLNKGLRFIGYYYTVIKSIRIDRA